MKYSVTASYPTGIPGYEPAYTMATDLTWEAAYDFAVGLAKGTESPTKLTTFDYARFGQELRDGATEASLVVTSRQQGIVLGRPFTPAILATYKAVGA
jgi:hypothetical protein